MRRLSKRNKLYSFARKHVPSYRDFLNRKGVRFASLRSENDFSALPVTDKKSYFYKYPLAKRFPYGRFPAMGYASSGSSGAPTFWFRELSQERVGAAVHERLFRDVFQIRKDEPTLVVISFAMGIWIAGHYTFASCRRLAERGYRLSIMTPALEKENIMRIMAHLAPEFKHTVLAGYPPFIAELIAEMEAQKIQFPRGFKILASGDTFTEEWRDATAERAGIKDPHHSIANVYGSADATVLGYETPLSIFVRRAARKHPAFAAALWGDERTLPCLVQYDPRFVYFEEQRGELLVTAPLASPLIRYNLHDRGNVVTARAMAKLLAEHGFAKEAARHGLDKFTEPFLILKGRTDVALTFYAANVYPEHLLACAEHAHVAPFASGSYAAYHSADESGENEQLFVIFELKNGIKKSAGIFKKMREAVIRTLLALSTELRKLHNELGKRGLPRVRLVPHGALAIPAKKRGILALKGKKPKMVVY